MTGGVVIVIAAFAAAFLGVFTINLVVVDIFQRDRQEALARLNRELMEQQKQRAKESVQKREKKDEFEEVLLRAAEDTQHRKGFVQRFDEVIYQSGLNVSRSSILMKAVLLAAIGAALGFVVTRSGVVAGALGGLFAPLPLMYVSFARRRRMHALLSQLPDALELMSRVLRAGQSITQGISAVADEFSPPISMEFGYCYEQQNLGLAPEVALHELSQRTGLLEMRIFVLALLVHKQSGGNLTTMLDSISKVVRERFKLRVEIKSLTAEGRLQAIALLALPVVMWIGLFIIVREYALKLFEHPPLVAATLAGMVLGAAWIRKIVNFDF
jgi:tight adherence protein B